MAEPTRQTIQRAAPITGTAQTPAAEPTDFERLLSKPTKEMTYIPFGGTEKIKLTPKLVLELLAIPTKSGKMPLERDALRFMMMCQARRLNPFEGDAFLVGYDTQDGPKFNLITAHQAFLKRAEIHPEYDGMESGITLLAEDGKTLEDRETDFHLPDEKVVGGWAIVYFKDRSHPTRRRVRMSRFNKGFGVWRDDPAGMIVKCAEADALRSSFPTMVGGLYAAEEMDFFPDNPTIQRPVFEAPGASGSDSVPKTPAKTPSKGEKPAVASQGASTEPSGETAEASETPPEPEQPAMNNLKALRGLLRAAKPPVKEGEILGYLAANGDTDGSVGTLEELQLSQPQTLKLLVDNWTEVLVRFGEWKGAE